MKMGRSEVRGAASMPVTIQSRANPRIYEAARIENISSGGARLRTHQPWPVKERVVMQAPAGDYSVFAEVVYCQKLQDLQYAIGLKPDAQVFPSEPRWPD